MEGNFLKILRNMLVNALLFTSSVTKSWLFVTPQTAVPQLLCPSLSLRVCSNSCPFNHFTLCRPLLFLPSIFLSIRVFSNESALHIRWPSTGASASASVLPVNIQGWFTIWGGLNKRLLNKWMTSLYWVLSYQRHTVWPCMVHGAFVESSKLCLVI